MKLLVVRHGRTDWNNLGKIQGIVDTNINEEGIKQAEALAEKLKNEKIDLIISSPLKRALQTASIINQGKTTIITDDRIIERDFGEYEGKTKGEFDKIELWGYRTNTKFEKAENIQEMYKRVYGFLDDIKNKYSSKTILLVIHGGVSVALNSYFEGIPPEETPTKGSLQNGEIREYEL